MCVSLATIVGGIFIFFQNFKLFFHEKIDFNLFMENVCGNFEPYVVVNAPKYSVSFENNSMVKNILACQKKPISLFCT